MTQAPSIKEALEFYAKEYCEGWCEQDAGCANFDDCGGCLARRALATFQPDGERREAIAFKIYSHSNNPKLWDHPNSVLARDNAYSIADLLLASGLVQDEAGIITGLEAAIRAAKLAIFTIRKQGVMPNSSWESGFNSDVKTAENALAAIRSARDGGAS